MDELSGAVSNVPEYTVSEISGAVKRTLEAGFGVAEVPITFRDRVHGTSKMSTGIVVEAMWRVTVWGLARPFRRRTTPRPAPPPPVG